MKFFVIEFKKKPKLTYIANLEKAMLRKGVKWTFKKKYLDITPPRVEYYTTYYDAYFNSVIKNRIKKALKRYKNAMLTFIGNWQDI